MRACKLRYLLAGKIFSILICMLLAVGYFACGASAQTYNTHSDHAVCQKACSHEELHDSVSFIRWTYGTFSSGSYYMDKDITLSRNLTITGNANLCLNGYTLTFADGYGLTVEYGANLTICDCTGNGKLLRAPLQSSGDSSIIVNRGTMVIGGGSYCPDGHGVSIYNTGTLTVYNGTFGIGIYNCSDSWSSSTTRYGNLIIHNATIQTTLYSSSEALYNEQRCTMTIYGGDYSSTGHVLRNLGTADIQGGKFHTLSEQNFSGAAISNTGTLNLRNATVIAQNNYAIDNGTTWNSSYTSQTYGRVKIYNGCVITGDSTAFPAIYNSGNCYVYGGTISGFIGIKNASSNTGTSKNGGSCYVSGGTITGTECAIRNSGTTSTHYQNGVPYKKEFSRGILEISDSPNLGKIILEYPESLTVSYSCKVTLDIELDLDGGDIVLGDTISTSNGQMQLMNLLNEGYVLLYEYARDIHLETSHCGATTSDQLYWKLTPDGKLTISGTGKMKDYGFSSQQPWNKEKTRILITEVVLEPGITHIGSASFSYQDGLTKIVIPEGVVSVGTWVFEGTDNLEEVHLPSTLTSIGKCFFATITGTAPPAQVYYNGCEHQWTNVAVDSLQPAPVSPICLTNENTDDGDCTTALICSVCSLELVPAREAHTGGTATCTELAKCDVCAMEYGTLGHEAVVVPAVAADCENSGLTEGSKCKLCDMVLAAQTVLPANGHRYQPVVTNPDCTEKGYTTHTCSNCGTQIVDNYVDALGHAYGEWKLTAGATCVNSGEECRTCGRCQAVERRILNPTGHDYQAVVTAPTCTDKGYTIYTCRICGDRYEDSYVDAPGHVFGEWTHSKAPTCTEVGEERKTCGNCDVYEAREVPAIGHSYAAVVTEPACTEQGYTTHTCSNCGNSYVDAYIDALDHAYGNWAVVKEPTYEEDGQESRTCSRCSDVQTRIIPILTHSYESAVTAPTCTEKGYTTHICNDCGDSYVDTHTDALGHSFQTYIPNGDATCTADGTRTAKCERCGITDTITDAGTAMGHSLSNWTVDTNPTCTEKGTELRSCINCGLSETREISATGHEYESGITVPTCEAMGYTTHSCVKCDAYYMDNYVNAIGHSYGSWQQTKAPTCTGNGEESRECASCGNSETNVLEATGHDYKSVVTEPTHTQEGFTTHTCTVCGYSYVDNRTDKLVMTGDFNMDGDLNDRDVAYLLWHTLFPDMYPLDAGGDLNHDGSVDALDVAYLLWHTLFPDMYPLN